MPNKDNFKLQKLTDFGTSEEWVSRIYLSFHEFKDKLLITEEAKSKYGKALSDLFSSLSFSFVSLRKIRDFNLNSEIALLTQEKEYSDFYNHLWSAYKDRFPKTLKELDFSIGFLYQSDHKFERGLSNFIKKYNKLPIEFSLMLKENRKWLNDLSTFRNNYLQHKTLSDDIKNRFMVPNQAEVYFYNIWTLIEDITISLLFLKLPEVAYFSEIEENKRVIKCPRKFEIKFNLNN